MNQAAVARLMTNTPSTASPFAWRAANRRVDGAGVPAVPATCSDSVRRSCVRTTGDSGAL